MRKILKDKCKKELNLCMPKGSTTTTMNKNLDENKKRWQPHFYDYKKYNRWHDYLTHSNSGINRSLNTLICFQKLYYFLVRPYLIDQPALVKFRCQTWGQTRAQIFSLMSNSDPHIYGPILFHSSSSSPIILCQYLDLKSSIWQFQLDIQSSIWLH